ncbi:hypothetical protein V8F33_002989 [Rhypophila sp. PSN 637]
MPAWDISYSQRYVNCAQVKIVGPGGGTPFGFAKFSRNLQDYRPRHHCARKPDRMAGSITSCYNPNPGQSGRSY